MIKLNLVSGSLVYLAPTHIQFIQLIRVGETEIAVRNRVFSVVETPEQIMAMPEVLYFMFPTMVINHPPYPGSAGDVPQDRS